MSTTVGKSVTRVDAYDKVTGRTKYYEDRMPAGALYIQVKHAEIAHGFVKSIDTAAAEAIDGVVKVLTCFDVPDIPFPTAPAIAEAYRRYDGELRTALPLKNTPYARK